MYGIANPFIPAIVTELYGSNRWKEIKKKYLLEDSFFAGADALDDTCTYRLAVILATELRVSIKSFFISLGQQWVLATINQSYANLVNAGGHHLQQFMFNLPLFQGGFLRTQPSLAKSKFLVSAISTNGFQIQYNCNRAGLGDFLRGVLQGLAIAYKCEVKVEVMPVTGINDENLSVTFFYNTPEKSRRNLIYPHIQSSSICIQ